MDSATLNQEKFQMVIDETNKVLNIWRNPDTKKFDSYPSYDEIQSLFLSKLRKILFTDYVQYSRIVRNGKPIVQVTNWRVKNVYSNVEFVNNVFAKCDYNKDIPGYEPVLESVHSINFNSINKIKFN